MGMRSGLVLAALAPVVLAACSGSGTNAPIACPTPRILADGADLTRYRPGPVRDLTTLEFDARLNGLEGGCRVARGGQAVEMSLTARFTVDRGAAAQSREVDLPWTVFVLDDRTEQVLGQPRRFVDRIVFGPNETRVSASSQPVSITLPVSEDRKVLDYRVLVFFQLTEEELALNRRRGPR